MARDLDGINEGKLDLVPMIDCVMLLLLFFILTTRFTPDELQVSALLPTQNGTSNIQQENLIPPSTIHLVVTPIDMPRGLQPSDYERRWQQGHEQRAQIRIGGTDPLTLHHHPATMSDATADEIQLTELHHYIAVGLGAYELDGARDKQPPIVIHCFSGLPWQHALAVYDAVRAYEKTQAPLGELPTDVVRSVSFAPPLVRGSSIRELGEELYGLVNLR